MRRTQWAIWTMWAALFVYVLIRGKPGVAASSLVVSAVGVLVAWPLARWWLKEPTVARAIVAFLLAMLAVCGTSAGMLLLRYYRWIGPPLIVP